MKREEIKAAEGILFVEAPTMRIVQQVMDRLYSERTMTADDMRDYAQKLQWVLDQTWKETGF